MKKEKRDITIKFIMKKTLCPNGVEYKALGEISKIKRGERVTKRDLIENGEYPVYSGGVTPMGYYNNYNNMPNTVIVVKYGTAGYVNFINEKFWANDVCYCITNFNKPIIPKFIYYYLKTQQEILQSQAINAIPAHLPYEVLNNFQIPLPPLEVQEEIVRILDTFTGLIDNLNEELNLRKKQYEYYRNKLLTPIEKDGKHYLNGKEVEWKTLGEVCNISSGGTPSKTEKGYWENGNIPWLKSEVCKDKTVNQANIYITELGLSKSNAKVFKINTTLIALVGATKCKLGFLTIEAATNQNIAGIKSNDIFKLLDKYIFYYLQNQYKTLVSMLGSYDMLTLSQIRNIIIPIPPIEEQERIVEILDKFDALVNDLSEGIPAEIEARTKQYEYYRNKLLRFE